MPAFRSRHIVSALAFGLMACVFAPAAANAQASAPFVAIPAETNYRVVLERHGQFYAHDQYGVVWVPTSMPQGWRPYSDCKWVQHKQWGWLYDDQTEWGRVVHHYGRWAHDERVGWMWIPGAEWSPGWVVWRTSESHVGWAPMPPDADVAKISVEAFNSDKHWMFQEEAKFKAGCVQGPSTPIEATAADFRGTRVVTQTKFVNGIFVYDVPVVAVNVVEYDVGIVIPWSAAFIGNQFGLWNRIWNDVSGQAAILNAALNQCTIDRPDRKLNLPIQPRINPPGPPAPPAPPQRRAELPPAPPPVVGPPVSPPIVVTQPPIEPVRPVITIPVVTIPQIVIDPRRKHDPVDPKGPKDPVTGGKPDGKPGGGTRTPGGTGPVKPTGPVGTVGTLPKRGSDPVLTRTVPKIGPHATRNPAGSSTLLRKAGPPPGPKFTPALRSQPIQPRFVQPKPTIQRFSAPQRSFQPALRAQPRMTFAPRGGGGFGRGRIF
jgi:hypothetical protein